jgi:hypothetical protein
MFEGEITSLPLVTPERRSPRRINLICKTPRDLVDRLSQLRLCFSGILIARWVFGDPVSVRQNFPVSL